jgi:CheY-like chemotaxis protein
MVKVGILHATLPRYMQESGDDGDSKNMQVVVAADTLKALTEAPHAQAVQALVLDLQLLGNDPMDKIEKLERHFKPEMTVVVYSFAKWKLLEAMRADHRNLMRAPVSMRALRSSMINLIVRNMMKDKASAPSQPAVGIVPSADAPKRRFNDIQLSALQDIKSEVDCECPNQVAHLVLNLINFEEYSKHCENKNEADAKVHAMLARATGHARAIMEAAMGELCEFEGIDVSKLPEDTRRSG